MDGWNLAGDSDSGEQIRLPEWVFTGATYEQTVDGTRAIFRVETAREHRRIQTLMYETDVLETVLRTVSAEDIFYDIGANIGVYTCFVGQHVDQVLAFEPHEQTAACPSENVELNEFDADVYEYAVADTSGTATLSHPRRSSQELGTGEFSLVPDGDVDNVRDTETVRGDVLFEEWGLPPPTVVKIDVEGAELRVLDGFSDSLHTCEVLFIEVHRDHVTVDEVKARLTDANFELEPLKRRGNTTFLKATSADSE